MLKKQQTIYNFFLKFVLIFLLLLKPSLADILKPSTKIEPEKVAEPKLAILNQELANELNLNFYDISKENLALIFLEINYLRVLKVSHKLMQDINLVILRY